MLLKTIIICSLIFLVYAKEKACPKLLGELANAQTLFVYCITTHSVPVSMCMSCNEKHNDVLQAYDTLLANCSSMYFDNDRINLVASAESMLTGLWVKANCDDCFNNNNSFVFNDKNVTFYDCLNRAKDHKCEKCKAQYMDLNSFYINLDQHNNGEVCFDLQDSMNRTRNLWSKQLNCCKREYNMTLFIIALSSMLCLPLIFYTSSFFITKYQEREHDRVLYDEPSYNITAPSTSGRSNINNINNPTSSSINNPPISSSSTAGINNNDNSSTPSKPFHKNGLKIDFNNDSDDDDVPMNHAALYNKEKLK